MGVIVTAIEVQRAGLRTVASTAFKRISSRTFTRAGVEVMGVGERAEGGRVRVRGERAGRLGLWGGQRFGDGAYVWKTP